MWLYVFLARLLSPWLHRRRIRQGKIETDRAAEYQGLYHQPRPEGKLLWFHAASIGESVSLLPLITEIKLQHVNWQVLMTTCTRNSVMALQHYPDIGCIHVHAPMDHPLWVQRFYDHWRPDVACWVESEFWPLLCLTADQYNIPRLLLNGRISERSFRFYSFFPYFSRHMIGGFQQLRVQNRDQLHYFFTLGAPHARVAANLKDAALPLPCDAGLLRRWQEALQGRRLWVAASTHVGEEEIIASAHHQVQQSFPDALCLIIPRHIERGTNIVYGISQNTNLKISIGLEPSVAAMDIQIIDQFGVLGVFYRLSDVVFIGGSLINHGGHNIREAALLSCAVVCGSHLHNFADQRRQFAEVLSIVTSAQDLAESVISYLQNSNLLQKNKQKAEKIAKADMQALQQATSMIAPYLYQDSERQRH